MIYLHKFLDEVIFLWSRVYFVNISITASYFVVLCSTMALNDTVCYCILGVVFIIDLAPATCHLSL